MTPSLPTKPKHNVALMSRIFRSDEVQIGDRVVCRRSFGKPPHAAHSDIIGHVTCLDPLRIRPQEVGGYPSSLPEVEVPAEQIYIIKKLSPRMVRNSDIRRVEALLAGFASLDDADQHPTWTSNRQWLLTDSYAVPLGRAAGFEPVPEKEILDYYAARGLPAAIRIPERIGKPAERLISGSNELPENLVFVPDSSAAANEEATAIREIAAVDLARIAAAQVDGLIEHHRVITLHYNTALQL